MLQSVDCRISKVTIKEYSVPFKTPLPIGKKTLITRRGLVATMVDEEGLCGYGEIAPLEGFSRETVSQARKQVRLLAGKIPGMALITDFSVSCTDYSLIIPGFAPYPSVAFGLETAAVNLLQNRFRKKFSAVESPQTVRYIPVNALLPALEPGKSLEKEVDEILTSGFKTIKIKVGRNPVETDLQRIHRVVELLPPDVWVRLDANRLWDFTTAVAFGKGIANIKECIEYIEEPFTLKGFGELADFFQETGIPVGLDETLQDFEPGELPLLEGLVALVIKPTLLGGFQRVMGFIDLARETGLKPVISSCFEIGPGFAELLKIAAAIDFDNSASGLDTLKYLQWDLFAKPMMIQQGMIAQVLPAEPFVLASRQHFSGGEGRG